MKICPKCGAEADGVFCINCGAAVNDSPAAPAAEKPAEAPAAAPQQPTYTPPVQPTYTAPQQPYGYQPQQPYGYYPPQQPAEKPISAGMWILYNIVANIGIVNLIMFIIWANDKDKPATFRNWAKSQLIVMGIAFGLLILLFIFAAVVGVSFAEYGYY